MKHSAIILIAATCCLIAGCGKSQRFTAEGTLKDAGFKEKADSIILSSEFLQRPITVGVNDGAFFIKGKATQPGVATLTTYGYGRKNSRLLILEKGKITFQNGLAAGTPLNDEAAAFMQGVGEIRKSFVGSNMTVEQRKKALEDYISGFVARHKDDPCAALAIMGAYRRMEPSFILGLIETCSPEIQNVGEIHVMKGRIKKELAK